MNSNGKFLLYAAGIFVSYFYYGVLQEKITRGKYELVTTNEAGENVVVTEKYIYALSLVFIQCVVSYLVAKCIVVLKDEVEDKAHNINGLYCGCAMTYLLAMVCSNMALQWVPYPTQVIGKAAKPIPVMLLGVLIGKKVYPAKKYICVLMVVVGVVLFMYKDQTANSANKNDQNSIGFGELLLLLSLFMDGLTGAMQELMRAKAKPSGEQMMLHMNFWSCVFLSVGLVLSGEGFSFFQFVSRHPYVLANISLLAIAGSIGQHFIYMMVAGFGPLPVSIVTTTRKFVTVLGSVLIFGNVLMPKQWLGAFIVFAALFIDALSKAPPKKKEIS